MFAFAKGRGFNIYIFFLQKKIHEKSVEMKVFRDEGADVLSPFRRTFFFNKHIFLLFYFGVCVCSQPTLVSLVKDMVRINETSDLLKHAVVLIG